RLLACQSRPSPMAVIIQANAWKRPSPRDRKSTRLNSSHANNSYAVLCLKKKTTTKKVCTFSCGKLVPNKKYGQQVTEPQRHNCCCRAIKPKMLPQFVFFFNDTATTEIYTLSLHDALPI